MMMNKGQSLGDNQMGVGACGQVDRPLDSRSEGLGFNSQC